MRSCSHGTVPPGVLSCSLISDPICSKNPSTENFCEGISPIRFMLSEILILIFFHQLHQRFLLIVFRIFQNMLQKLIQNFSQIRARLITGLNKISACNCQTFQRNTLFFLHDLLITGFHTFPAALPFPGADKCFAPAYLLSGSPDKVEKYLPRFC